MIVVISAITKRNTFTFAAATTASFSSAVIAASASHTVAANNANSIPSTVISTWNYYLIDIKQN